MRKLKLLIAACTLMMGAGQTWAQKDVTAQYITNAKLSDGTNGWTKTFTKTTTTTDPADAFSKSTQGTNTVGYATEAYAGWGSLIQTAYSMKQTITLPAGSYRLVNYSFYRQGGAYNTDSSKSLAYLVAGEDKVALKTLGSITATGYANSQAEGANVFDSKMYRNVIEFTIDADNTNIEIGVEGTFDEAKCWCIVGMFELFDLNDLASVSSPTDVTYAITNPGFEYRDLSNWNNNITVGNNQYSSSNNFTSKSGVGYYESWLSSANGGKLGDAGTFTQTLKNMQAGLYELSVYAHNVEQGNSNAGGTGMFVTANSDQTEIGSIGQYKVRTTLAEDGDLTIGIKLDNCSGNWIAFDRFELQFYGDPLEAYRDLLNEKVTAAQTLHDGGTLPTAAAAALQTVINANDNDDNAFTTEEQFNTAIGNIEAAITTAETFVTPYAEWIALKAKANTLKEVANDNSDANSTLVSAISAQDAAAEAATTVSALETATSTLKSAMATYVGAANPVGDDAKFDCTFLMTNPDLTGLPTWATCDGWYTEQSGGNSQVMQNDEVKSSDDKSWFYEYWSEAAAANDKFTLYQKLNLAKGTYTINCYAFAAQPTGGSVHGVYFYANETQGSCVTTDKLTQQEISFVNSTEQEVKIGLKALSGNNDRWMGIGYVQLFKVPAKAYTVDETAAWDNTTEGAGDVTLKRTIKEGVNTLVLPFSMTQEEVESNFGTGSKVYAVSAYDATSENISFTTKTDGISANQPCLLKATAAGTSYTLEGRTIVAGEPVATGTAVKMTGTYAASLTVPTEGNNYIISGGKIYNVDSNVTLKNTRAYITLTAAAEGARALTFSLDGETTGIATLQGGELKVETGNIYDLSGRKVSTMNKGVYVVNGKKIVK